MTRFFALDFNIPQKESTYLYKHFAISASFGDVNLIVGVKQNVDPINNRFYNTIKEAFIKLDNYNLDLYQRCLTQPVYVALKDIIGDSIYVLSNFFAVLDTREVETTNDFTVYFFDNR